MKLKGAATKDICHNFLDLLLPSSKISHASTSISPFEITRKVNFVINILVHVWNSLFCDKKKLIIKILHREHLDINSLNLNLNQTCALSE